MKITKSILGVALAGLAMAMFAIGGDAMARGGGGGHGGGGHGGGGHGGGGHGGGFSGGHGGGFSGGHGGGFSGGHGGGISGHVSGFSGGGAHVGHSSVGANFSHGTNFSHQNFGARSGAAANFNNSGRSFARSPGFNGSSRNYANFNRGNSLTVHNNARIAATRNWNQNWNGDWNRNWVRGEQFRHNAAFARNYGNRGWYGHPWYARYYYRPFWTAGGWWPWWNLGYGYGNYGNYGYNWRYYSQYPVYENNVVEAEPATAQSEYAETERGSSDEGAAYFGAAADAFRAGNYHEALRLANHAAVESPQNAKAAELMSLSSFALGDYDAAAAQAHAALAMGPPADWSTLFGYYGDAAAYTTQLRALEKYSDENDSAPDAHFLLGYQYLMTGYSKNAGQEFGTAAKLAPDDKLAVELAAQYGGAATPATPPAPPTAAEPGEV